MNELIAELFDTYSQISRLYMKKKWFRFRFFYLRLVGDKSHFIDLIAKEYETANDSVLIAENIFKNHEVLDSQTVAEVILALKNHRERLVGRAAYLTLISASVGLLTAAGGIALSIKTEQGVFIGIVSSIIYVVLHSLLVERDKLNNQAMLSNELVNILDLLKIKISDK
ncbi:hypothetical protein NB528_06820 [Vibrio alginolyticus]|nr:hypothetical protein [Vibrio alginolyticus]